jgi:hypothetical protein
VSMPYVVRTLRIPGEFAWDLCKKYQLEDVFDVDDWCKQRHIRYRITTLGDFFEFDDHDHFVQTVLSWL